MKDGLVYMTPLILLCCTTPKTTIEPTLDGAEVVLDQKGCCDMFEPRCSFGKPSIPWDLGDGFSNQNPNGWVTPAGEWLGGEGAAVGDLNNDGLLDVFLPTTAENLIFIQQENGGFTEESDVMLDDVEPAFSIGATVVDVDADNDLDILVLNDFGPHQLLINDGGSFIDRATEMGFVFVVGGIPMIQERHGAIPTTMVCWTYLSQLSAQAQMMPLPTTAPMILVQQMKMHCGSIKAMTNLNANLCPDHNPEPYSCCGAFIDIDGDRDQDLYIVNDYGAYVQPNMVFQSIPVSESGFGVSMSIQISELKPLVWDLR